MKEIEPFQEWILAFGTAVCSVLCGTLAHIASSRSPPLVLCVVVDSLMPSSYGALFGLFLLPAHIAFRPIAGCLVPLAVFGPMVGPEALRTYVFAREFSVSNCTI